MNDQHQQLLAEKPLRPDLWRPWGGAENPPNEPFDMVRFRDGDEVRHVEGAPWEWNHTGDAGDIVAYRTVAPVVKTLSDVIQRTAALDAALDVAPRILPDNAGREQYPLYDGLFAYFPAALCEVARWSVVGNAKHNPGQPLHWAREKSTDHENKILRHLLDARQVDKDGFVEAVALVWRSLALCQTILEERGWAEGPNARRSR